MSAVPARATQVAALDFGTDLRPQLLELQLASVRTNDVLVSTLAMQMLAAHMDSRRSGYFYVYRCLIVTRPLLPPQQQLLLRTRRAEDPGLQ